MTDIEKIKQLIKTKEFKLIQEKGLKNFQENQKFDFMSIFINSVDEMALSKLFAYLFDSRENHNFGQKPFRKLLELIPELKNFSKLIPSEHETETACTTEIMTYNSRRIDILIQLIDKQGKVKAVLGIENKIYSGEQKNQIRDYQKHLVEKYDQKIPKIIIFLTPDGRNSQTLDGKSECSTISVSYNIISEICENLKSIDQSQIFLNILKNHMDKLSKNKKLDYETVKLINKLYLDPNHRHAIKLISQNVPNSRSVFESLKLKLFDSEKLPFTNDQVKFEYHPRTSFTPQEFKLYPHIFKIDSKSRDYCACYMLYCNPINKIPDIGDTFTLKIMLWIEELKNVNNASKNEIKSKVNKFFKFPNPIGINEEWGQWICLWTGENYKLVDMGDEDVKGLKKILINGIEKTYNDYKKGMEKFGNGYNKNSK